MNLTSDQRATIVENDALAQKAIASLWQRVLSKEITPGRASRLQSNIEGNAIARWRLACATLGTPLSSEPSSLPPKQGKPSPSPK